jgi:hypothetical protein
MSDNWEDWENEDYSIPILNVPNEEQLKQLIERKLVEESDKVLTNNLFSNFSNGEEDLVYQELKKNNMFFTNLKNNEKNTKKKKNTVNNQKLNEEKQKILSKNIKQQKAIKQREKELFGEVENDEYNEYNEYIKYEDKFY